MRRPHLIAKVKGNELPHAAVWFDTETDQEEVEPGKVRHVLRFGWLAYRRRTRGSSWSRPVWRRFETPDEFWDIVESLRTGKTKLYLFSHNSGFDLPVVDAFNILPSRGYVLNKAVVDCPPVILSFRKAPVTLLCLDTLNIWRVPLEKLGSQIGLPKLDFPGATSDSATWDTYAKRDVEIIMEACLKWWEFLDRNNLGGFANTLAGQAFRTYRHRFMTAEIYIDDHEPSLSLARSAYLGGRTEAFRIGPIDGPLYQLDVNAMYPFVMHGNSMPTRLISFTRRASIGDLARWCATRCVIARVLLSTDEPVYPVVHGGRLVFPVGLFTASLSTPEIEYAIRHGHVLQVECAAVYECADIFSAYVDFFTDLRNKAKDAGDAVADAQCKLFNNGLYGKFGQRGRVYEVIGHDNDLTPRNWIEYDRTAGTIRKLRSFAGVVQEWREEGESRDSHPAIAAHVTSHARMYLWHLYCAAGRENVYYSDTDSLVVNELGYGRLRQWEHGRQLGMLKLEHVHADGIIHGPKDYVLGSVAKTKGVKKGALWTAPDTVEQDQWSTIKGLIRAGDLTAPTTTIREKKLRRVYLKGDVQPDGGVLPFVFGAGGRESPDIA